MEDCRDLDLQTPTQWYTRITHAPQVSISIMASPRDYYSKGERADAASPIANLAFARRTLIGLDDPLSSLPVPHCNSNYGSGAFVELTSSHACNRPFRLGKV